MPVATAAVLLAGVCAFSRYSAVHAASAAVSPLNDSSVSSLEALDNAVEAVAARVTPAVVNVAVTSRPTEAQAQQQMGGDIPPGALPPGLEQFFGGHRAASPNRVEHGIGSGVIISPDGYILTNNHVVDGAVNIRVTMNDRRVFPAKLVGADKLTDLAVLKINATGLPFIGWGDSTRLHPGQSVLAFGSPFGYFQFSVTRGIVSAVNRPNPYSDDPRKPGGFIQTDAAINPGNSGGPLVNARGELVGINTFIISDSGSFAGAGFAIPSQIAKATADAIIEHGVVHHGYLGISMNDVTPDNASFFNLPDASGAIVSQITPDSPAAKAGMKSGDVIRELNGTRVDNGSALQVAVSEIAPGKHITLGILRDGKPESVTVQVGEFHKDTEQAESGDGSGGHGKLGLAVADLTPDIRNQLNLPDQINGVAIANVRPGSPADEAGLTPGDIIQEIDRHPVKSADSFANEMHSSPVDKSILLLVWSHGGSSYRVVHPAQSKQDGM
uniref:Peptidase S1C, Do n=1 Tax=mine drainage metagenome TaxID=410659 RepID=E6QME2_9ZZZZ